MGQSSTDSTGYYTLGYTPSRSTVNLELRVVDAHGKEVTLCDTKHGAASHLVLNLVAPGSLRPLDPEYQRITADIAKELGGLHHLGNAREDDEQKDLTLLANATGWDARLCALASIAHALADESKVPPDILYALLRAGKPTDKHQLARISEDEVQ